MKFIRHLFLILVFGIFGFAFAEQEQANESTASKVQVAQADQTSQSAQVADASAKDAESNELKDLTPEEIEYLEHQRHLDKIAVDKSHEIRRSMKNVVDFVEKFSPKTAEKLEQKFYGIRLIHYLGAIFILLLTLVVVRGILNFLFKRLAARISRRNKDSFMAHFIGRMRLPLNVLAGVIGLYFALVFLIHDSEYIVIFSRAINILFLCASFWFIVVVLDAFFFSIIKKFAEKSNSSTVNLLDFLRRVSKVVLVIIVLLFVMHNCGINVNTIIASLGIGGMALAFASQETIANFFGSVSIIIDRPFVVGDWVKTPECEGNIEKIGFRSTKIKTFAKTLVTIPNASLAKEPIENFSKMPVRKVIDTLGFVYSTTATQLEEILPLIRSTISQCEGVDKTTEVLAEFTEFADSSLNITVVYYTEKIDYASFTATKTRVNLALMRLADAHRLSFAYPSTSVYIEKK